MYSITYISPIGTKFIWNGAILQLEEKQVIVTFNSNELSGEVENAKLAAMQLFPRDHEPEIEVEHADANPSIKYPFEYIDTKQEVRNLYDKTYNEQQLYSCGDLFDINTLKEFCSLRKSTVVNGYYHIITFFDSAENAMFSKSSITAMYPNEEKSSRHIKAHYTYSTINGYSKLVVYTPNQWEGTKTEIDI